MIITNGELSLVYTCILMSMQLTLVDALELYYVLWRISTLHYMLAWSRDARTMLSMISVHILCLYVVDSELVYPILSPHVREVLEYELNKIRDTHERASINTFVVIYSSRWHWNGIVFLYRFVASLHSIIF